MTYPRLAGLAVALLATTSAYADLTLRWKMSWKFTEGLPKQLTEAAGSGPLAPTSIMMQYRDGRAYMEQGPIRVVADYDKGLITMFNPDTKHMATVAASDYPPKMDVLQNIPPEARKMFDEMKFDVQTQKPGRFETIRGIKTEEYEIRMALTMPTPAMPFEMKFVMNHWIPTAAEVNRVPALKQCAEFMGRAKGTMDPSTMLQKAFASFPGAGEKFRTAFDEIIKTSTSVGMRMRMTLIMPSLKNMVEPMRQQGVTLPADFDGTLGQMNMELEQMDETPIADSVFTIPQGYEKVPIEELFKLMSQQYKQKP